MFGIYNLVLSSCAQVAAPPGGKKDTLAPVLVSSIPAQKSKNYVGKKIEILFNEYVDIKNINQELLVTPSVGFYETKINPKGLSIILDSALQKNTTYTFNFRNAVSDISERNIAKNIKVVFSTGNLIDSLSIKGNVKNLDNNKNIENALVALYPYTDTLAIDKVKPSYFTKTDTSGNYQLENIAAGKYFMSSFVDINNNLIVNTNKEPFAILPIKFIELKSNIEKQDFQLSIQNTDSLKILKTTTTAKTILYEFNRGLKELHISSNSTKNDKFIYQIENKQNVRLYKSNWNASDTLFLEIQTKDSLDRTKVFKVKSKFREANKKEKIGKQVFNFNIYPKPGSLFSPLDSIQIDFEKPISSWNIRKIYFQKDSLRKIPLSENQIKLNSYSNQLKIASRHLPKEKTKLIIEKNAFVSVEQDSTDKYELEIIKEDIENYGLISGKLNQIQKGTSYIVQLINEREQVLSYQLTTNEKFLFQYIQPEIYLIKVIEDRNGDGYWTPGNLKSKQLPERIFFFPTKLKLKANFELTDLIIPVN
ncbi:MAG: hypothetical protein RJA76_1452 [Bacteroidota bacterium]|jgi:uncharacterized protein (DUF2141 family)